MVKKQICHLFLCSNLVYNLQMESKKTGKTAKKNPSAGKLFVITGPSGVGKGTILEKFFHNNKNIIYSISQTTRKPRPGEVHGVNYFL